MNERLKELYRQAHGTRHYDGDPALDGNPPTVYWQGEASAQRFANLIVRECVSTLNDMHLWQSVNNQNYPGVWHDAVDQSINTIKEHFGVK